MPIATRTARRHLDTVIRRQKREQWLQFPGCRQGGHREKARNGTRGYACAPLGLPTSEGQSPPGSPGRRERRQTLQPIRSRNMSGQHWNASPTTIFRKHDSWDFHPHTSLAAHPPLLGKAAVRSGPGKLKSLSNQGCRNATISSALPARRLDRRDIALARRPVAFYRRNQLRHCMVDIRSLIFFPRPHGIVATRPAVQSPRQHHHQTTVCQFAP